MPSFIITSIYTCVQSLMLLLADELGDFTGELKLSLFQLGISPQIIASIIMQVAAFLLP